MILEKGVKEISLYLLRYKDFGILVRRGIWGKRWISVRRGIWIKGYVFRDQERLDDFGEETKENKTLVMKL